MLKKRGGENFISKIRRTFFLELFWFWFLVVVICIFISFANGEMKQKKEIK